MKRMNTSPIGANKIKVTRIHREIFLCDLEGALCKAWLVDSHLGVALDIRY